MTTLVWIPARRGSTRIAEKNLQRVGGATLVARSVWTGRRLRAAAGPGCRVMVDTDAPEIAAEARAHGAEVPFLREAAHAGSSATSEGALLRFLERLDATGFVVDTVVVLQPTSPLRSHGHVLDCWHRFVAGAPSVVSVRRADVEISAAIRLDETGRVTAHGGPTPGRAYCASGAVYVARRNRVEATGRLVVPGETVGVEAYDPGCLDVDWPWQLELADGFARARGPGGGCRIVAEAGVNHNGDLDLALALVDAAAEAGADAVKFQTFDPVRLVSAAAPMAPYQTRNTGASTSQREMLDALALPREWHRPLMERCAERGIGFLSSPFDEGSSDFLAELGVSALKLPSGEITNLGLLDHVATLGLPVILSTGMSTLGEVMDAVERLAAGSVPALTLLHCVSDYPTRPGDANLRAMDTLRSVFEVPVGWSDHTPGWSVAVAAAARGAALIEKHLTLDRGLPGPDHAASLEPDELGRLVAAVREAERALGDGVKRPREAEVPVARVARKSLHLRRAVAAGAVIGRGDLVALRPGTGVPPGQMASMVGRRARVDLAAGALLSPGDLEPRADAPGRGEGGEPEGSDGTGSGGAGDGG